MCFYVAVSGGQEWGQMALAFASAGSSRNLQPGVSALTPSLWDSHEPDGVGLLPPPRVQKMRIMQWDLAQDH